LKQVWTAERETKAVRHLVRRSFNEGGSAKRDGGLLQMKEHYYVYTLQSFSSPNEHYTGHTEDIRKRLSEHNAGKVPHTSKFIPWEIRSATAFRSKDRAVAFERYLKSGSGRAFLHRHL